MTALSTATAFIAAQEGFRSAPYKDVAGNWTIGYGFTYTPDGRKVTADTPHTTQEAAYARLQSMVASVEKSVRELIAPSVVPTDNQIAALVSFAFNEGTHALRISTILALLNEGKAAEAAKHFAQWVYAGGHVSEGLVTRRRDEAALFLSPDVTSADDLNASELNTITEQST